MTSFQMNSNIKGLKDATLGMGLLEVRALPRGRYYQEFRVGEFFIQCCDKLLRLYKHSWNNSLINNELVQHRPDAVSIGSMPAQFWSSMLILRQTQTQTKYI